MRAERKNLKRRAILEATGKKWENREKKEAVRMRLKINRVGSDLVAFVN
jgi:hypothetical protein